MIIWIKYKAPEPFFYFWTDLELKLAPSLGARELLMKFENLGENCEMGFVQSHYSAEPLSLFRWNGISMEQLVQALNADLTGMGALENTDFHINTDDQEYFAHDRIYGMNMHTHTFSNEMSIELIKTKFCRRITFLKEKILRDIANAEKIFVFHSASPISKNEMRRLHQALRRHGPRSQLLCVQTAQTKHLVGHVEPVEEGLLAAFLDRAGLTPDGWNVSFELWLHILYRAYALLDRSPPSAATARQPALS